MLIFPPTRFRKRVRDKLAVPPLGVASIAAVIREHCDVRILDATVEGYHCERKIDPDTVEYGLGGEEIGREIRRFRPDVVGISCIFSSQYPAVREICRLVKEISGDIRTVTGGSHPTFLARECLGDRNLDYVILGEGDYAFRDLLGALRRGGEVAGLDGIAYRSRGEIRVNPKTRYIENLDELPLPARDLLPMERYFAVDIPHSITPLKRRHTTLITSRGCPQKCTFCPSTNFWGNRARVRSPGSVLAEMHHLKDAWGIEEIQFEDDNLTFNPRRARDIFQAMIDEDLRLKWSTPNGVAVWTLNEELLDLMKESGCYELTLGIESGSQEVLDTIIRKPLKIERAFRMVEYMKQLGIRTCGFFILGFPGETREQVYQTLRVIKKLKLDKYMVFIFNPLPGSGLMEMLKERGLANEAVSFQDMSFFRPNYQFSEVPEAELEKLIMKEVWMTRVRLLFRNPVGFLQRYGRGAAVRFRHRVREFTHRLVRRVSRNDEPEG